MGTGKNGRKKKNRRRQEKSAYISVSVIVLVLTGILSVRCYSLYQKNEDYKAQVAQLEEQKAQENEKQSEMEQYQDYVSSDAFTIETARQKLGLVFPGEIIFRSADKKPN